MRIAIIRLSALGDIVVAMSFLPQLKKSFDCQIDWFVDERFAEVLYHSPLVNRVIALPLKRVSQNFDFSGLYRIVCDQRKMFQYDLVVDIQGLCKSAVLGWLLKTRQYRGFDSASIREKIACVFYREKIHIAYEENILKRNAKILGLESTQIRDREKAFGFTQKADARISEIVQSVSKPNVLLVIEASKPQKMYPIDHFILLCQLSRQFDFWVLYHSHLHLAQKICNQTHAKLLPKLNLDEVKALVAKVDAVIGGDTGIVHLAWALHKPSITLYGNTPLARFKLDGKKHISLSANPRACYAKEDWSISQIQPQRVAEALVEILE